MKSWPPLLFANTNTHSHTRTPHSPLNNPLDKHKLFLKTHNSAPVVPLEERSLDYAGDPLVWDRGFRGALLDGLVELGCAVEAAFGGAPQECAFLRFCVVFVFVEGLCGLQGFVEGLFVFLSKSSDNPLPQINETNKTTKQRRGRVDGWPLCRRAVAAAGLGPYARGRQRAQCLCRRDARQSGRHRGAALILKHRRRQLSLLYLSCYLFLPISVFKSFSFSLSFFPLCEPLCFQGCALF
jgi:hypothetical protein